MISRRNRSTDTAAARSGDRTLTTTSRASAVSRARNTRDMPPPPSSRPITNSGPSCACSRSASPGSSSAIYSARRATTGSARVARQAGSSAATKPASPSVTVAASHAEASSGLTP